MLHPCPNTFASPTHGITVPIPPPEMAADMCEVAHEKLLEAPYDLGTGWIAHSRYGLGAEWSEVIDNLSWNLGLSLRGYGLEDFIDITMVVEGDMEIVGEVYAEWMADTMSRYFERRFELFESEAETDPNDNSLLALMFPSTEVGVVLLKPAAPQL